MSRHTVTADGRHYTIDTEHQSLVVAGSHFPASLEALVAIGKLASEVLELRSLRSIDGFLESKRRVTLPAEEGHPPLLDEAFPAKPGSLRGSPGVVVLPYGATLNGEALPVWDGAKEGFWTAPEHVTTPEGLRAWHAETIRRMAAGLPERRHGRRSARKI